MSDTTEEYLRGLGYIRAGGAISSGLPAYGLSQVAADVKAIKETLDMLFGDPKEPRFWQARDMWNARRRKPETKTITLTADEAERLRITIAHAFPEIAEKLS